MAARNEKIRSESSLLLTPDFFQSVGKQFDDFKITDAPSNCPLETTPHCSVSNDFPVSSFSENRPLKLAMPSQSIQQTEYYSQLPIVPHQQPSFAAAQAQHPQGHSSFPTVYNSNDSLYSSIGSPSESYCDRFTTSYSRVTRPLTQSSFSLPMGFSSPSSPHSLNNLPRVKIRDDSPRQWTKTEQSNDYYIRLNRNYMEERDFVLGITPGVFYDTPNGIHVEMKNGCHYEITLANKSSEDCDVDLFVDMELVYRIRLEAYSSSPPIDGPVNRTKKFVFLRSFDAPPEANIINRHERNGQIKAVFKPKMVTQLEERRRAWSADSAVSCSQFLNQAIGNIVGPPLQGPLASSPPSSTSEKYRGGSFCSGATALQSNQREKYHELAEHIKVDEKRMVVLQLRLVARTDDQSRPSHDEPITPLITKMPPPLPY